jgi:DNA/RNA endonuclease YhcR with UshA esterase domain
VLNPPVEAIAAVTTNDADGVALRLNDTVRVRGVLTSPNTRTNGYSMGLQDATGGVLVFKTAPVGTVSLAAGDSVEIVGVVAQFNGLTEILPDSIFIRASGRPLPAARVITTIDEASESEVVKLTGPLTIVTPAQWVNTGSGFNVDVTDGTTTYQMRVLRGTDVYGSAAPTQPFRLTGLGGQFDNAAPFLEGYQLIPRFLTDIELVTATLDPTVQFGAATLAVDENAGAVLIPVTVTNPGATTLTIDVQLATPAGTATWHNDSERDAHRRGRYSD